MIMRASASSAAACAARAASCSRSSTPSSVLRMRKPSALMKPRPASVRACSSCTRASSMRLSISATWARARSSSMR